MPFYVIHAKHEMSFGDTYRSEFIYTRSKNRARMRQDALMANHLKTFHESQMTRTRLRGRIPTVSHLAFSDYGNCSATPSLLVQPPTNGTLLPLSSLLPSETFAKGRQILLWCYLFERVHSERLTNLLYT